ncbi:hypothetical protein [Agrococcus casei]|uniref:hypothetical protein n=1 Tax=Agrococcus casei TaxID=343512 RepID=UPI003F92348A
MQEGDGVNEQLRINPDAYTRPVSADDRREYGHDSSPLAWIVAGITFVVLTLLLGSLFLLAGNRLWPWLLAAGIAAAVSITTLVFMVLPDKRGIRSRRFAAEHGFVYALSTGGSGMQGVLFEGGTKRHTKHAFSLPGGVVVSDFEFEPSGSNATVTWRYIELPLPRMLPHLVLDATSNNGLFGTNLPQWLAQSQRISLEGDFNQHFALYAPRGYDFDVRYLLPPDSMALLIDNLAQFDVEFFGDRMRIVTKGGWPHDDPQTWQFVEWVVNVLWPHFWQSTIRYEDARAHHLQQPVRRAETQAAPAPGDDQDPVERFREQWERGEHMSANAHAAPSSAGSVAPSGRKLSRSPWKTVLSAVASITMVVVLSVLWFLNR